MTDFEQMVEKAYYLYLRYGVEATFALLYHSEPLKAKKLGSFLRLSDSTYDIDDHHIFIVFSFTDESGAYKASENLLPKLDHYFGAQNSYIALDAFDTTNSPQIVLKRLMQILSETRKDPFSRIENEKVLDRKIPFSNRKETVSVLVITD